tara:strand:- start:152 stop:571 length:420 start_codon:yes stop_codon:yes gene_type:complete
MANIQLQRGQNQQIDVTFKNPAGSVIDLDPSGDNPVTYDAELVIRQKEKNKFAGAVVDVLRHGTSSPSRPDADGRITFASVAPNISLKWSTAQSNLLPNLTQTIAGDLKITQTSAHGGLQNEVVHHINLKFDIIPEIIE